MRAQRNCSEGDTAPDQAWTDPADGRAKPVEALIQAWLGGGTGARDPVYPPRSLKRSALEVFGIGARSKSAATRRDKNEH